MKRRDTIKTLLIGGIAGASLTVNGCKVEDAQEEIAKTNANKGYGRTPEEKKHDEKIKSEIFLNSEELTTIAVLCDIILPATVSAASATEAEVPEFIDFIVKDLPANQLPIRGGLMWLNGESNKRFNKIFVDCTDSEQIEIIEDIAYPDPEDTYSVMAPGRAFFSRMRNLTLTGYYTTKMGFDDLGYVGNRPNLWDGVPQYVLDKHGLSYEAEWIPKFVDHSKRNIQAEWDEHGNLLT